MQLWHFDFGYCFVFYRFYLIFHMCNNLVTNLLLIFCTSIDYILCVVMALELLSIAYYLQCFITYPFFLLILHISKIFISILFELLSILLIGFIVLFNFCLIFFFIHVYRLYTFKIMHLTRLNCYRLLIIDNVLSFIHI